jgi:hypothetical protein
MAHLPFTKRGSLRDLLGQNEFLDDLVTLASKENGLDIEGFRALPKNKVFFGLRGPLAGSFAIVAEAKLDSNLKLTEDLKLHFIDLGGLGVRDLTCLSRRHSDSRRPRFGLAFAVPHLSTRGAERRTPLSEARPPFMKVR